jgi:bacterioferritin
MGTKAREIVELDVDELIAELNKAYADEWLAFNQYWISAELCAGMRPYVLSSELKRLAAEEMEHAEEVTERILQLGGKPPVSPKEWYKISGCGYADPPDPVDTVAVMEATIKGEQCAIDVYNKIAKMTHGKDPVTYQLALHIMEEELEHEDTIETLLEAHKKQG